MQPKTMSKVLVAIDFSAQSIRLLECVYDLCQNDVKTIILTHVFEDAKDAKSSGAEWQEVIHQLTSFKKKLVEKGFEVKIVTPAGEAAIEITNLAIQEQVDLIIMASSGKGYIQSALMGSTSFDVVRLAKCPVFVERGKIALKTTNQAKPARLAKVLLPTDFSLASLEALSIVRSLHDKIGEVVFANVIEKSRSIDDLNAKVKQAERNLIELVEEMNAFGIKASYRVKVEGAASKVLLNLMKEEDITLTILPKTGAGIVTGLLIGSTAQAISLNIDRPVLLVPTSHEN
ncbi:universal stress protein [Succinispira mobilis]|uniref:universal stress protein n=1 Tax=Succinispira mobilis TaxID=78120 RepID=UPI0003786F35|nr:universal stress protein [Succinispira mobilis]